MFSRVTQVRPPHPTQRLGGGWGGRRMWLSCDLVHPQELAVKSYQFLKRM